MDTSEVLARIENALDYVEFGNVSLERRLDDIINGIERLRMDGQRLLALYTLTDSQRYEPERESSEGD